MRPSAGLPVHAAVFARAHTRTRTPARTLAPAHPHGPAYAPARAPMHPHAHPCTRTRPHSRASAHPHERSHASPHGPMSAPEGRRVKTVVDTRARNQKRAPSAPISEPARARKAHMRQPMRARWLCSRPVSPMHALACALGSVPTVPLCVPLRAISGTVGTSCAAVRPSGRTPGPLARSTPLRGESALARGPHTFTRNFVQF